MKKVIITYLVCITYLMYSQNNVDWVVSKGVAVSANNNLTKTTNTNWGNSGAISENMLLSTDNGWIEFAVSALNQRLAVGFVSESKNIKKTDVFSFEKMRIAVELHNSNKIRIYRNGEQIGQYGNYKLGDVIRIEKINNTYYFKKNSIVLTQLELSQRKDMRIMAAIHTQNLNLTNVRASFLKPLTVEPIVNNAYCSDLKKGNITLNVSGGAPPYSYLWSNEITSAEYADASIGNYVAKVTDASGNKVIKNMNVLSCVLWQKSVGVTNTSNTLTKTQNTLWGNAGANSLNLLKGSENGYVQYIMDNENLNLSFGLDELDTTVTSDYKQIGHGFYLNNKALYVTKYGKIVSSVGRAIKDDVLKIEKKDNFILYFKNDVLLFTEKDYVADKDLRIETALYKINSQIKNIVASFFRPPLEVDIIKQDITEYEPNSGLIDLQPKYGLPPYKFYWDNGSNENALYDIGVGTYKAKVVDRLDDVVYIEASIGEKLNWVNPINITFQEDEIHKINIADKAGATISKYIPEQQDGWYEFSVPKLEQDFSFALREFLFVTQAKETAIAAVKSEIRTFSESQLVNLESKNIIDTTFAVDSVKVLEREFVAATRDIEYVPGKTQYIRYGNISGIQIQKGELYVIFNGKTIEKPFKISENDIIRIGREKDYYYAAINGKIIYQENVKSNYNLIGDLSLNSSFIRLTNLTSSNKQLPVPELLIGCPDDINKNWESQIIYDGNNNPVSESKQFSDYLGRPTQTLIKNFAQNNVIASQVLYDKFGQQVLQTLPAPVFQDKLCYKEGFITNSNGANYTYNDYDKADVTGTMFSGEINNPNYVGNNTQGTLGWYYGQFNNIEPYVASATTPYTRIEYNKLNPADIKKVSAAGEKLNSGSGHETYGFTMPTLGEVNHMFGLGRSWVVNDLVNAFGGSMYSGTINTDFNPMVGDGTIKRIAIDQNGIETVSFFDLKGNLIASSLAGKDNGVNVKIQNVQGYLKPLDESKRYIDIHLPVGCENSLQLYQNATNQYVYNIIDLKTGKDILFAGSSNFNGSLPNLNAGLYRIVLKNWPVPTLSSIPVKQKLNYYNFALNYYDKANRLRVSIPPKGFDNSYTYSPQISKNLTKSKILLLNNTLIPSPQFGLNCNRFNWSFTPSTPSYDTPPMAISQPATGALQVSGVGVTFYIKQPWNVLVEDNSGFRLNGVSGTGIEQYTSANLTEMATMLDEEDFNPPAPLNSINNQSEPTDPTDPTDPTPTCYQHSIIDFHITYVLQDQDGHNIVTPDGNAVHSLIATCTNIICTDGTTSRQWKLVDHYIYPDLSNMNNPIGPITWVSYLPVQYYIGPNPLNPNGAINHPITNVKMKIVNIVGQCMAGTPYDPSILSDINVDVNLYTDKLPAPPNHTMGETNEYDTWGQLLTSYSPDAGKTDFVYTNDGKIKYTQNSKQNTSNATNNLQKFSYVNYDAFDRPIEKAEYDPSLTASSTTFFESYNENATGGNATSLNSVINKTETQVNAPSNIREKINIKYDLPDPNFTTQTGLSVANYPQSHLMGEVSYSYNENKKTWYSYDEQGRVIWLIQRFENINGAGTYAIKTINYKYDFLGNVLEAAYQKENTAESFYHYYVYDNDKQLKRVYTSRDGVTRQEEAEYYYYLHGPLKRIELANKLQGVDFVYTINGWLKTVNAPEMDNLRDPGKDGLINSQNRTPKDLFGMALDYFEGDYNKQNTHIQTIGADPKNNIVPDLFNGTIKAQRWQTKTPLVATGLAYQGKHLVYGYNYDKKYQLKNALFGNIDVNGNQNIPLNEYTGTDDYMQITTNDDYKIFNLNYDLNGNILSLNRNAYASGAGGLNLDKLTYSYLPNTNKLDKVTDAVAANPYNHLGFKAGQLTNNYTYNVLGELNQDVSNNKKYEYNSQGQITKISDNIGTPILEYIYDAGGQRIYKKSYNAGNVTTTWYVRDEKDEIVSISENTSSNPIFQTKEWTIIGEERLGTAYNTGATKPEYIYEIDDHLSNQRTTFKAKNVTNFSINYDGTGQYEHLLTDYNQTLDNTVDYNGAMGNSVKVTYPAKQYGATVYKIPVKYGQTINFSAYSKYTSANTPNAVLALSVTDANGNFIASPTGNYWVSPAITGVANSWNLVSGNITITDNLPNMYVNIFPWNQSTDPVWFDNLNVQISGTPDAGIIVPEQLDVANYYPHGSVMPGLNFNSTLGGRNGYQGQYAEMDKEVNENFFELRNYNPLLGRFNTTDPYNQYHSPYLAMGNNPINNIDPDGGNAASIIAGAVIGAGVGAAAGYLISKYTGGDKKTIMWSTIGGGVAGAALGAWGGSNFDWNIPLGRRYNVAYNRWTITKNKLRFGNDGHWFKKMPSLYNLNSHFSVGFRVANFVLWDIRWNAQNTNKYQINFPGRWNLNPHARFRFSLLYRVWNTNPGHYKIISENYGIHMIPFVCFFGTYNYFNEHDEGTGKKQSHAFKRYKKKPRRILSVN